MHVIRAVIGCFFPFLIGAAMRYASRKWERPLPVTVCLIFAVIVMDLVISGIKRSFFQATEIRVMVFAFLILGALTADFLYRIRRK